jgi:hypothetical protein
MNKNPVNMKAKWSSKLGFDFILKEKKKRILATDLIKSWFDFGNPAIGSQNTS